MVLLCIQQMPYIYLCFYKMLELVCALFTYIELCVSNRSHSYLLCTNGGQFFAYCMCVYTAQ